MARPQPDVSSGLWGRGGKRLFDVVFAAGFVLVLSPVLVAAALLIKLTSRGPLLFSQDRSGREGVVFQPYKFRTMTAGRRHDPTELVPLAHPDITLVGRFLRRFKIDELPQLFNVLTGEMSLVGPRPTLPDQTRVYDDFRRQRLAVRPGLTGLAQVNGDAGMSWDERILYDIVYVQRSSLLMDLGILVRTVAVVTLGEGVTSRRFLDSPYARFLSPPPGYPIETREA